jgi:hypothetical protein
LAELQSGIEQREMFFCIGVLVEWRSLVVGGGVTGEDLDEEHVDVIKLVEDKCDNRLSWKIVERQSRSS